MSRKLFVWGTILLLSALTVFEQERPKGTEYIESAQLSQHEHVMRGVAPNPWSYRLLSEILVAPFLKVAKALPIPHPIVAGFLAFRLLQNIIILWLVATYYRLLGFSFESVIVGLAMLGWSMGTVFYNSDLELNTYTDLLLYVLAAIAIVTEREFWTLPITLVGVVNRETIGLVPVMVIVHSWWMQRDRPALFRRNMTIALASLVGFAALFLELRLVVAANKVPWSYWGPRPPGITMLKWNLFEVDNARMQWATFSVLPFLVILCARRIPPVLQAFLVAIVPVYVAIHYPLVNVNETRYFLMPLAVVFIPAALSLVARDNLTRATAPREEVFS